MTLYDFQMAVLAEYCRKDYSHDVKTLVLGLCEEVGELAAATLNMSPDYVRGESRSQHDVLHELGDCLVYIAAIANSLKLDLDYIADEKVRLKR